MAELEAVLHIMAVDCCEHTLAALASVPSSHLTAVASTNNASIAQHDQSIDLIIIGVARYPVRRLFISQLRRIYRHVPLLILRRDEDVSAPDTAGCIRGEFILSDQHHTEDCEIVKALRQVLPLPACAHTHKGEHYDVVGKAMRVITEKYTDPELDLPCVARELPMSPTHLSRLLNQKVGVSFRQLLRQMRIEEAKRMLASRRYSVKEVALRVGFSNSHYFSRSFKEVTGQSASQYRS
jgi:AraC-like DNA-binding protein